MAPQTATRMTYEEFMALPESSSGYELIEGELIVNPAPVPRHQGIIGNLFFELQTYFRANGGGRTFLSPIDVVLSRENVIQPDVVVILMSRASILGPKNVQGAPNIAVEVLSDRTRRRDENVKRRLCETFGVDEYWLVDPDANGVKLYRRSGTAFGAPIVLRDTTDMITSPLLPQFALPLAELFSE